MEEKRTTKAAAGRKSRISLVVVDVDSPPELEKRDSQEAQRVAIARRGQKRGSDVASLAKEAIESPSKMQRAAADA
eukprot:3824773-Prorocentrum_lima.AAC.1